MFALRQLSLLLIVVALCACGSQTAAPPAPENEDAPAKMAPVLVPRTDATTTTLDALPAERVARNGTQRTAQRAAAGTTLLELGTAPADGMLRFSLMPAEGSPTLVTLYENDDATALAPATHHDLWASYSMPVRENATIALALKSDAPHHVAGCRLTAKGPQKPDVLIYLIDTLRKDHLGCYFYPLDTSPQLDAFSKDAVLFRDMIPMSSWTRPSVATLMTGTLDATHHAISPEDNLREGLPSLAALLAGAGYETHSVLTNPAVGSLYGFGKDFQWHQELWQDHFPIDWPADVDAVDRALEVIEHAHGQPLFMYVHTMAPHRDYTPPTEYADLFMPEKFVGTRSQVRVMKDLALYDAEIRFSDDQFGRVIQALKDAGRYDNALILVLSDHGEQFMEHGEMAHANTLHFAELAVPFILKLPGNKFANTDVSEVVRMVDAAPTLLEALGLPTPAEMEGRSLMPLVTSTGTFPPQPAVSRLRIDDRLYYSAQTLDLKYIHDSARGESTWYHIFEDPAEQFPLRQPPEGGEALKAYADAYAAQPIPDKGAASPPLTQQQREELEALGYL